MYVENMSDEAPYDNNLGFSLNPIKNIQQVAAKVQAVVAKVAPPIIAKLSPTNVIAQQTAAVAKVDTAARALTLRVAQEKAKSIYAATAASPLGKKLVSPMLDAGAIYSPIGKQLMPQISANVTATRQANDAANAQYAKQQADADAQYQREYAQYLAQQAALDAQSGQQIDTIMPVTPQPDNQAYWQSQQSQLPSNDGWGSVSSSGWGDTSTYAGDVSQLNVSAPNVDPEAPDFSVMDTPSESTPPSVMRNWWDWWNEPVKPWGHQTVATTTPMTSDQTPALDSQDSADWLSTYYDTTGDNMQLSNIESSKQLFPGDMHESGMGDIWSDLMSTGVELYNQKSQVSIAQSQAAQADATARIAAANAAAVEAQNRSALSTPVMLAGAAVLAGALYFMRKKRRV